MDITDFNFISSNRIDQIAFYHEGTLSATAPVPPANFVLVSESIPTEIDEILYPSLLMVSKDNSSWYAIDSLPPGFGFSGGLSSKLGVMRVAIFAQGYVGPIYYRATGVYND